MKKYEINWFSFYDKSGIEIHLNKMASKGWILEKVGTYIWTYTKDENASDYRYSVTYYPKGNFLFSSIEDYHGELELQEFCRHSGWEVAGTIDEMQIFRTDREDAVPIDTDVNIEIETIEKSMHSKNVILIAAMVFAAIAAILSLFATVLAGNFGLTGMIILILSVMMCLVLGLELNGYSRWIGKAKMMAELEGIFAETRGNSKSNKILCAVSFGLMIILGLSFGSGAAVEMILKSFAFLFTVVVMRKVGITLKKDEKTPMVRFMAVLAVDFVLIYVLYSLSEYVGNLIG